MSKYIPIEASAFIKLAVSLNSGRSIVFKTGTDSEKRFVVMKSITFDDDKVMRSLFLYAHERRSCSISVQIPAQVFDDMDTMLDTLAAFLDHYGESVTDEKLYMHMKIKSI